MRTTISSVHRRGKFFPPGKISGWGRHQGSEHEMQISAVQYKSSSHLVPVKNASRQNLLLRDWLGAGRGFPSKWGAVYIGSPNLMTVLHLWNFWFWEIFFCFWNFTQLWYLACFWIFYAQTKYSLTTDQKLLTPDNFKLTPRQFLLTPKPVPWPSNKFVCDQNSILLNTNTSTKTNKVTDSKHT